MRSEGYEIYENVTDLAKPVLGAKMLGSSSNQRIYQSVATRFGPTVTRPPIHSISARAVNSIPKPCAWLIRAMAPSLIFKKCLQKSQPAAVNINFGDAAVRQSLQDSINKSIAADPGLLRPFMAEDAADRVTINSKTNVPDLYWDHVARTNQLAEEVKKYREA